MNYLPLEDLVEKTDGSLYKLVIMASRRALELSEGAEVLSENAKKMERPTLKALWEIKEERIGYVRPKKK